MGDFPFCPCCNEQATVGNCGSDIEKVQCPNCGEYYLDGEFYTNQAISCIRGKLASFFLYNKLNNDSVFFLGHQNNAQYLENIIESRNLVKLTANQVNAFWNLTFSRKMDKLLLYLADKCECVGIARDIWYNEFLSAAFVQRYDNTGNVYGNNEGNQQYAAIKEYLVQQTGYLKIDSAARMSNNKEINVQLTPRAWQHISELQKQQSTGNLVFVAMSFAEKCKETRERIKAGIASAGYTPVLIDEVKHNHQIVPEMFRYIRESKFLVLDITEPNCGAYYEAGYALGLGKEVIICCQKDRMNDASNPPHFDIRQKQMLVYKDVFELSDLLKEWIWSLFGKNE